MVQVFEWERDIYNSTLVAFLVLSHDDWYF